MMQSTNADEISELNFSIKELNYPSSQHIGYYLFLGNYFSNYNELSSVDKQECMSSTTQVLADDISVNTTDTPPTIHISEFMKDAGRS